MGKGIKALLYEEEISKQLVIELNKARQFRIGMALITSSGLDAVHHALQALLQKGGAGSVLVGTDLPTEPSAIETLMSLERLHKDTFKLRRFQSGVGFFHPKLSVFVRRNGTKGGIIGSSNLTKGGLYDNYEANIFTDDKRIVQKLLDYFDELFNGARAKQVDAGWLRQYKRLWTRRKTVERRVEEFREKARTLLPESPAARGPTRIREFTFAFTGRIRDWPRESKLYPRVRHYGGHLAKSAGSMVHTSCLVHGDILGGRKSTQKLIRAREMRLPIITEERFFKILKNEVRLRGRPR